MFITQNLQEQTYFVSTFDSLTNQLFSTTTYFRKICCWQIHTYFYRCYNMHIVSYDTCAVFCHLTDSQRISIIHIRKFISNKLGERQSSVMFMKITFKYTTAYFTFTRQPELPPTFEIANISSWKKQIFLKILGRKFQGLFSFKYHCHK